MLSITDKDGTIYKFEDYPKYDVQLHAVRNDKIIGSYIDDEAYPIAFNLNGSADSCSIELTPYDKFKDLKKAYSEGAIIEYYSKIDSEWHAFRHDEPMWYDIDTYRIKGGISIESWDKHKDLIKQYWNDAEIEYYSDNIWKTGTPSWHVDCPYRVKPQAKEMTLSEIADELGYNVKVIK